MEQSIILDTDGIRLAHAVGNLARANPANQQLARLTTAL